MVDAINVTGSPALVAGTIGIYRRAGVDVSVIFPLTRGTAREDTLESTLQAAMGPAAHDATGT